MDAIVLRDLRVEASIGIHRRERHVKQYLAIDLDIGIPGTAVFSSDRVADTVDYEQVALKIAALTASGHFRLVETVAERIAGILMKEFRAPWCRITVAKIGILPNTKFVGVTIERGQRA